MSHRDKIAAISPITHFRTGVLWHNQVKNQSKMKNFQL